MKKLLILSILFYLFVFSIGSATMEEDLFISQTYESICENFGTPNTSFVNLYVWTDQEGGRFIGAFQSQNSETVLVSYLHISSKKEYVSGTIAKENTAINLLKQPYETFVEMDEEVFDIGSGLSIPARITSDGYIVYYIENYAKIYNCFTLSYENAFFFRVMNIFLSDIK